MEQRPDNWWFGLTTPEACEERWRRWDQLDAKLDAKLDDIERRINEIMELARRSDSADGGTK